MENDLGIVSSWLESLAPSSPQSTPSCSDHGSSSWIVQHPSALTKFDQILNASKGKKIAIFLDYDGTLSEIVRDPESAFMTTEMRDVVRDIATYFPTAIIIGRSIEKVKSFVQLEELYYAGSHGMDIKGPSNGDRAVNYQPDVEIVPMIDEVYKAASETIKSIPGALAENNKFCLSVHYRCVDQQSLPALFDKVASILNDYPKLKQTHGKMVLEIRPVIEWDKGKALEFLLESLGYDTSSDVFPVYIGDDKTDEDAFKVLRTRGQGFGILVSKSPKETNALYSLQEPIEVQEFLQRLVEWKRLVNHDKF